MKRGATQISLVIAVLTAGFLLGCSSPKRELRKAKAAGTTEALDAFLARHPEGPLAEEAKDAKEQLAFDAAKLLNTPMAYNDFLKRYPNRKLAGAARAAIEDFDFSEAQTIGTIQAYDFFLRQHPQGAKANQACIALDRLLPSGMLTVRAEATSADSSTCTIYSAATILHKSGALSTEAPPAVTPGPMDCVGTIGATSVEIEKVAKQDLVHTVLHLKSFSTAGWSDCRGTCTVRFTVMGQEQAVTAVYK